MANTRVKLVTVSVACIGIGTVGTSSAAGPAIPAHEGVRGDAGSIRFVDATEELGLGADGGIVSTRLCVADLNTDGRPDVVIRTNDKYRVFLHTLDAAKPKGFSYVEVLDETGLPAPAGGDCVVFADIDNDTIADAIVVRNLDVNNEKYQPPADHPKETAWLKGNSNGTFGMMHPLGAKRATTACVAVGDADRDGRLDLYLGNWYSAYGTSNAGFTNDLYLQSRVWDQSGVFRRTKLPEDDAAFSEDRDEAGRPTYGVMIAELGVPTPSSTASASLLELNYGRRANRVWAQVERGEGDARVKAWEDVGVPLGLDGDAVRHGQYPAWLKERAKTDPRFDRADELPFRSHGNTFDASIGDIDNDGRFDIVLAEIAHAWAGDSSDRSRVLFQTLGHDGAIRFEARTNASLDRIPPPPEPVPEGYQPNWNQGDLYCELADLDHDGRLDVILASGDYPDAPPYDNRLRLFHQQADGSFKDVTGESGIDHVGAAQISLTDIDGDGDIDLLVGQSYNRFPADLVARTNERQGSSGPRMRVFLNQASQTKPNSSITIRLQGSTREKIANDALGAIVRLTTTAADGTSLVQSRQLIGIGGHAGKQHQFLIHFGLAGADRASKVEVIWPTADPLTTTVVDPAMLAPGHYVMRATRRPAN